MQILTKDEFVTAIGTGFAGSFGGREFEFQLKRVQSDGDVRFPGSLRDPFTLHFESVSAVPQGTYVFANPAVGEQAIFVVPIARTEAGFAYEAAFN